MYDKHTQTIIFATGGATHTREIINGPKGTTYRIRVYSQRLNENKIAETGTDCLKEVVAANDEDAMKEACDWLLANRNAKLSIEAKHEADERRRAELEASHSKMQAELEELRKRIDSKQTAAKQ